MYLINYIEKYLNNSLLPLPKQQLSDSKEGSLSISVFFNKI